jgi:hypothetical protein
LFFGLTCGSPYKCQFFGSIQYSVENWHDPFQKNLIFCSNLNSFVRITPIPPYSPYLYPAVFIK